METEAVVNAEIKLLNAIRNGDLEILESMLHDDLLFNLSDGNTITKEQDLNLYRSGKLKIHSLETADQLINIIGDTAVVTVTISLNGEFDCSIIQGVLRYIRVWKQFGESLKVIAGSCVALQ
jgi:ketosteroid isomerase-like protein